MIEQDEENETNKYRNTHHLQAHLHPKHRPIQRRLPRILPRPLNILPPNLLRLPHRLFPTNLRHLIPMQDLHDLLCPRLPRPDLGILDRLLFLRLEFRVSHPASNIFRRRLGFAKRFVDVGVAGQEVAEIDAAALAESVGVVGGWGVGDAAGGAHVCVGELVGLIAGQLVHFAGIGVWLTKAARAPTSHFMSSCTTK